MAYHLQVLKVQLSLIMNQTNISYIQRMNWTWTWNSENELDLDLKYQSLYWKEILDYQRLQAKQIYELWIQIILFQAPEVLKTC